MPVCSVLPECARVGTHAWPGGVPGHTRVDVPLCPREGAEGFLYTGVSDGGWRRLALDPGLLDEGSLVSACAHVCVKCWGPCV